MLKYAIEDGQMNDIMELLSNVLNMRVTFFELQECELDVFNIKEMSRFCKNHRKDESFKDKCIKCDKKHLVKAKNSKGIHIYHCHAGLLEGIVPLYSPRGIYLGSIVFGQLRDKKRTKTIWEMEPEYLALELSSNKEMKDTGTLLKYLGEYIIENEIIKYQNKHWVDHIEDYIDKHLNEKITLAILGDLVNRSISFLSHNIPIEFGMSLKDYIRKKKMNQARALLESGMSVHATATQLGYYDEFHFSKDFKRYFGNSPKNYKKS